MKKLLLFTLCVGIFASCGKNLEDDGPVDATKQKTLMDKSWQMVDYLVNNNYGDENSTFNSIFKTTIPDCARDDYFVFKDEDTLIWNDNWIKCLLSEPDTKTYYYSLTNKEKNLTVWSDNEEPDNSFVMGGELEFPSVDTFFLSWDVYNAQADQNVRHKQIYIKTIPL